MVSKVEHAGVEYLVDKRTGLVYSPDDMEEPVAIGHWTQAKGVVLGSHRGEAESAIDQVKDEL